MAAFEPGAAIIRAWETNNRVTAFFLENLPPAVWALPVPGAPRRTVRMIAGHIHNARCMWVKMLGRRHGIPVPRSVNRFRAGPRQLLPALARSSRGIVQLLELGLVHEGKIPGFPLDIAHFLAYFVAHEGHHRGQILMIARQLGHRLPAPVATGIWQWSTRAREAHRRRR